MLTLQQIFDKGYLHIIKQGHPSVIAVKGRSQAYACVYRSPNGDACIAGGLFADEDYDPIFDKPGVGVTALKNTRNGIFEAMASAMLKQGIDLQDAAVLDLITGMQACHDQAALRIYNPSDPDTFAEFLGSFRDRMKRAAQDRGLKVPDEVAFG